MNKVILVGRFTKDPELKYGGQNNDMAVMKFSLAVDRKYKKDSEQTADFPNCIAFGKTAEFISKYFKKGNKIAIEGRIQTGSYTNKEGQKVYTTDIAVEDVEFVESKKDTDNTPAPQPDDDGFMNIPDGIDEELPFN